MYQRVVMRLLKASRFLIEKRGGVRRYLLRGKWQGETVAAPEAAGRASFRRNPSEPTIESPREAPGPGTQARFRSARIEEGVMSEELQPGQRPTPVAPDQPKLSDDGKFYWDGQHWVPLQATPPVAKKSGAGRGLVIGCLLLLVLGGGGVLAVGLSRAQGHTIHGTMALHEDVGLGQGSCTGQGGYDDIHDGTAVVIKDESSKVLATGSLGSGTIDSGVCLFHFTVSGVPDANFYEVEVSHRGNVTYSKADIEKADWEVDLELGA